IKLFSPKIDEVFMSFPENSNTFQIISSTNGFAGMVTVPWSERTKTAEQLQLEASVGLAKIPGVRVIPLTPPSLPGGGTFPVDIVLASTAEPERLEEFANQLVQKAFGSGLYIYADSDLKFDQPQA